MLARLQRALAFAPSRFARQLSTIPPSPAPGSSSPPDSSLDDDGILSDDPIPPQAVTTVDSIFRSPQTSTAQKPNGLSYIGLPDSKIFLDIPSAQDPILQYLTSSLQHDGRRHSAERRAARVLLFLHTLTRAAPLELLRQAIEKVAPAVRIARHRRSAKDIQIPVALNEKQRVRHAVKWMLKASDSRGGRTVEERLAREIVLVMNGSSSALKQKEQLHQLATVNRGNIPTRRAAS